MREMGSEFRFRTHTPEEPPVPPEKMREHVLRFDNQVTEYVKDLSDAHPHLSEDQLRSLDTSLRAETAVFQTRETGFLRDLNTAFSKFKKKALTTLTTAAVVWSAGACRTDRGEDRVNADPPAVEVVKDPEFARPRVEVEPRVTYPELRTHVGDEVVDGLVRIGEIIKNNETGLDWYNSKELKDPYVSGFEDSVLGSNEFVHEAIDILPKSLQLHIGSVVYKDTYGVVPEAYGLVDQAVVIAQNERLTGTITFFKGCNHKTPEELFAGTLIHEAAHGADWLSNKFLTTEERLEFLNATVERVMSENRFISSYVESINNENKRIELIHKTAEYWAEIVEEYHKYEHGALPREDIELVSRWLKKIDPHSNPQTESARTEEKMFELTQRVEASIEKRKQSATVDGQKVGGDLIAHAKDEKNID